MGKILPKKYEVYLHTDSPYEAQESRVVTGINAKDALSNIFPLSLYDIKGRNGSDVNVMLTPVYFRGGVKYKPHKKRRVWFSVTKKS